jgi:hypothetical protein
MKRSRSVPGRVRVSAPDVHAQLKSLGSRAERTAGVLAELVVETGPSVWELAETLADTVCHEMLVATDEEWRKGVEHGKWIARQELDDAHKRYDKLLTTQAQLCDLTMRFNVLQGQYEEAKRVITRASMRDISNTIVDLD